MDHLYYLSNLPLFRFLGAALYFTQTKLEQFSSSLAQTKVTHNTLYIFTKRQPFLFFVLIDTQKADLWSSFAKKNKNKIMPCFTAFPLKWANNLIHITILSEFCITASLAGCVTSLVINFHSPDLHVANQVGSGQYRNNILMWGQQNTSVLKRRTTLTVHTEICRQNIYWVI